MARTPISNSYKIGILTIVYVGIVTVLCIPTDKDLIISWKEKKALDELTHRVSDDLPKDYMKQEVYLINWVRATGGNVDKAENMLRENLKWRKEYGMDHILKEDFTLMENEYPIDIDGVDYTGRPVLLVHVGDWDVRKSHLSGQHDENYRYSMRALEIASLKVREAQERGLPVTRFQVIFDMNGFNLVQHGCIQCIPPYLKFIKAFQNYYPGMVDNLILINVPEAMESVLKFLRPVIRPRLRKVVKSFGTNKAQWKKFLLSIIPQDQLDSSLGGTREKYRS